MSQFGNQGPPPGSNPFQNKPRPYGQPATPGRPGGSRTIYTQRKQKKKMSPGMIIGIVFGVVSFSLLCCCATGCGFWYFSMFSSDEEMLALVKNNKELNNRIGEVQSLKTMVSETANHPDIDVSVFKVQGTQGSGVLIINWIVDFNGNIEIVWMRFRDDDGIDQPLTVD